jgi:hypothetical protein
MIPNEEPLFNPNQYYFFVGEKNIIEDNKRTDKILGKFLNYKDVVYWGDILPNAKAIFEYGTISSGYYNKVLILQFTSTNK